MQGSFFTLNGLLDVQRYSPPPGWKHQLHLYSVQPCVSNSDPDMRESNRELPSPLPICELMKLRITDGLEFHSLIIPQILQSSDWLST